MKTNPPFLHASGLSKRYGKLTVLDQLELSIEPNSFFALLGDNGAGKSTLFRLFLGIEKADTGTISLNGTSSPNLSPEDFTQLGYVSSTQLLPRDKNLEKLSRLQEKLYPTWDHSWLLHQAKQLDLPHQTSLGRLSRGQAMKAKLLLALAHKPRFILLDEPFDGLDVLVKEECIRLLIDWMNAQGGSVLMSSHEIDEVEQLTDRVGILRHGRLTHNEPLPQLLERHRRISFRSESTPTKLPDSCIQIRHSGRTGEFIETRYNANEISDSPYTDQLSNATHIEVHPMSLKDIYIALAREARQTKEGGKS